MEAPRRDMPDSGVGAGAEAGFWDRRYRQHGHTGWNDPWIYRYDQRLRLAALDRVVRGLGLGDGRGRSALDLGCGTGDFTALLLGLGYRVTGLDISGEVIAHARRRFAGQERLVLLQCRAQDIDFEPDTFDLALSVTVLQHLVEPGELGRAVASLVRSVRPGGYIMVLENLSHAAVEPAAVSYVRTRSRGEMVAAFQACQARLAWEDIYPQFALAGLRALKKVRARARASQPEPAPAQGGPSGGGMTRWLTPLLLGVCLPLDHLLRPPFPSRWAQYRLLAFAR